MILVSKQSLKHTKINKKSEKLCIKFLFAVCDLFSKCKRILQTFSFQTMALNCFCFRGWWLCSIFIICNVLPSVRTRALHFNFRPSTQRHSIAVLRTPLIPERKYEYPFTTSWPLRLYAYSVLIGGTFSATVSDVFVFLTDDMDSVLQEPKNN